MINKVKRNWNYKGLLPYLWILAVSLGLLLALLNKQEFWTGYDTYFHMNGIYEDAMQIKTGHFSYFLSLFGFERSGRIVNGLYGPLFNYLCGALLLLCHSWVRFEFWLFLITMVIGGVGVYRCAISIDVKRPVATVLTMLYLTSEPVTLVWLSDFEFIGLGATVLLPYVILAGIRIFQQKQIKVVPLAVLMAICLQVHLMTAVIAALVLTVFTLGGFIFSNHKFRMIKNGILAVLLAICLSGNIIGTIYDVYSTNRIIPTFPNFNLQRAVNHSALQFTDFYITEFGVLYTFFLALVVVLMLINVRSTPKLDWCLLSVDLIFLWLASVYFPWDQLLKSWPWLASVVQFPSRFMATSFLVTLLLVGRVLTEIRLKPRYSTFFLAILFLMALASALPTLHDESRTWQSPRVVRYWVQPPKSTDVDHGNKIRAAFRSPRLSDGINVAHKVTADYMPTPCRINLRDYYRYPIGRDYTRELFQHQEGFHKASGNHELLMTWRSRHDESITVPLVKYQNTIVELNRKLIHPKRTLIGTMKVRARPGINQMTLLYQPGVLFKILSALTVVSWLWIIIYLLNFK